MSDWGAVAGALSARLSELDMTQRELAERAGVSVATLQELRSGRSARKRYPTTLAAISRALNWPDDYLTDVLEGATPSAHPVGTVRRSEAGDLSAKLDEVLSELRAINGRLDDLSDTKAGRSRD